MADKCCSGKSLCQTFLSPGDLNGEPPFVLACLQDARRRFIRLEEHEELNPRPGREWNVPPSMGPLLMGRLLLTAQSLFELASGQHNFRPMDGPWFGGHQLQYVVGRVQRGRIERETVADARGPGQFRFVRA